ncbi:MAG: ATP-binding protein [Oscillospiraceae bacterium]|nr:ATP-binding protein [Oscillospiraceae bacterium]
MNEICIEARPENIDTLLDFVRERLETCPQKILSQIEIAADEIFSNIARYAYHPNVGSVTVRIAAGSEIAIEFEDSGVQYNPLAQEDPDITLSAEEREIGGLGVFLVKKIMDSVEYRREGERNVLTVRKGM